MRIAFFVVGTYGDVVPIAALGASLAARGHEVVVATSRDHRRFVEARGLLWTGLSPSYADVIAEADEELGRSQASGARLLRARMIAASADWPAQARAACTGASLLIGAGTAMGAVAAALGEAHGIPVVHAHVMPLTPTRHYPPPLPPPRGVRPGLVNLLLWKTVRLLVWRACFAAAIGRFRRALDLPDLPWGGPPWTRRGKRIPVLYNFSPALMPPPPDWPRARVRLTGAWLPPGTSAPPDPALVRFVEDGEKPIYVGFGSMDVGAEQRDQLAGVIAAALRITGRRALLHARWAPAPGTGAPSDDRVMTIGHAPFDWLFPRLAAVVHHGGAGTVGIAARAGTPQVIVPFVIDQFFWAWQLGRLGVAPTEALDRQTLTAARLAAAIETALRPEFASRAAALARAMAAEDGVETAIAALREWGLLGPACPPPARGGGQTVPGEASSQG